MTQTATATRPNPHVVDPPAGGELALRERAPGVALALVPTTITEAMQLAEMLAKSSIVPKDFYGKPGDVFVAMQYGMELGLSPLQAIQSIAVVNGRPCIWGDAVLGLVRNSGKLELFEEEFHAVEGDPLEKVYAVCRAKRKGVEKVREQRFSWRDAQRAGLADKPLYKQYPQRMLAMRARSWVLRDEFGDVLKGLAIREEVEDYLTTTATVLERVEPAEDAMMPRRKSEAGVLAGEPQDSAAHHDGASGSAAVPPAAPAAVPGVAEMAVPPQPSTTVGAPVSDEDDYLAAQLGLDPIVAVLRDDPPAPAPAPEPDHVGPTEAEQRAKLLAAIDALVTEKRLKAQFVGALWDKHVGADRDVAPLPKLEAMMKALDAVPTAPAPPVAAPAAPTPPPAKSTTPTPAAAPRLKFMIGTQPYETAGITKAQLLKSFRLGEAANKKAGRDIAGKILKEEFSAISRTELTEESAERYLIRLEENA